MKKLILGTFLLIATQSFAAEVVLTKCDLKSSTWPVRVVRNQQTGALDQKPFEVTITQEDPNSFFRDSDQNGLDLMFPLKISLSDNSSIEGIMPSDGLKSGSLAITASKFLKKRILHVGLISDEVTGILEVKGSTVAAKNFDAKLVTVSKSGATAIADLSCTNLKN